MQNECVGFYITHSVSDAILFFQKKW